MTRKKFHETMSCIRVARKAHMQNSYVESFLKKKQKTKKSKKILKRNWSFNYVKYVVITAKLEKNNFKYQPS